MIACSAFGCEGYVEDSDPSEYCKDCRNIYSAKALELMDFFQAPIKDILVSATTLFNNAQGISDYLGISLPTLYSWITRFHGLSFRQFKRKYICPAVATCVVLDHDSAGYGWKYTIADRIHNQKGCCCFIEESDHLMMATLTPQHLSETLGANLAYEHETGIHHIRYPIRLPMFRPDIWVEDGKALYPVKLTDPEKVKCKPRHH